MPQLRIDGVGGQSISFVLPALNIGGVPVSRLPGTFYGWFPYQVVGSPSAMMCGTPQSGPPYCYTTISAVTNRALYARGPEPTPPPPAGFYPPFKPEQWHDWDTPTTPATSDPSINISITDSNGHQVYLFTGAGGQAFPGGLTGGTFTITATGLLGISYYLIVP